MALKLPPGVLDSDAIWAAYISSYVHTNDMKKARELYCSLIDARVKSYLQVDAATAETSSSLAELTSVMEGYCRFEAKQGEEGLSCAREALRTRVERCQAASAAHAKPLIELWRRFELEHGSDANLRAVDEVAEAKAKKRARLFGAAKQFVSK